MAIQSNSSIKIILLDIEGTTTPIDFVYQILFPYARTHLKNYLNNHRVELQKEIADLQNEHAADLQNNLNPPPLNLAQIESVATYLFWLMDRDRKATPLKSLQGKIWEEGYRNGELKSQFFSDVPEALKRWRQQQKRICIFSSGSVLAQKLLFTYTEFGDLSQFINDWFDTNIGGKKEAQSYLRIAAELGCHPQEIIFISDATAELEAAGEVGMTGLLSLRPGNHPQENPEKFITITSFDELR